MLGFVGERSIWNKILIILLFSRLIPLFVYLLLYDTWIEVNEEFPYFFSVPEYDCEGTE